MSEKTKINIEVKVSKNYNSITVGIQDEPVDSSTEEEFKKSVNAKLRLIREIAEGQISLVGSKEIKS